MSSHQNGQPEDFFSFTEDQLIRGKTPADIEQRCLDLCQAYIGGSWNNATLDDLKVTRITGGLTNQLYRVQLSDSVEKVDNPFYSKEPTDVAIKLFQSKFMISGSGSGDRLNDIIILTALEQYDIGPKVYGIFADGTIQGYTEHEHFRPKHQKNPDLIKALADLLARIHNLNVPISKSDTWPISEIDKMLDFGYNQTPAKKIIESHNLIELKSRDLRDEFAEIKDYLKLVDFPLVFSHNDYIGTNVLVTKPDQKLVAIDFEYSNYFARAWDIAVYYAQWGIEPFDYTNLDLPEDFVLENFIKFYIEAMDRYKPGYSGNAQNKPEKILREVKVYMLAYLFYIMSFFMAIQETVIEAVEFGKVKNMKMLEKAFQRYKVVKQRLIDDGTLNF